MKINSWKDIWFGPFKYDHYGYVWDKNNTMVFTIDDLTEENDIWMQKFCENIVKALNGEDCFKYPGLYIKDGCDLYQDDKAVNQGEVPIGSFRGWGHLTGGLKLSCEDAVKYQDEMINFVLSKICK